MIYVKQNIYAIIVMYITVYIILLHTIYYTLWTLSMCCNVCTVFFACVWKENKNDLKIKKVRSLESLMIIERVCHTRGIYSGGKYQTFFQI